MRPTHEGQCLASSPRKKRLVKRPARYNEGLSDEEATSHAGSHASHTIPPPKTRPKQKSKRATKKMSRINKKAPKFLFQKSPEEKKREMKEIELEVLYIKAMTAMRDANEVIRGAIRQATNQEKQPHTDNRPVAATVSQLLDKPMDTEVPAASSPPGSSPQTLIRKPAMELALPAESTISIPQNSRYSGRKMIPKIRDASAEHMHIPKPRRHGSLQEAEEEEEKDCQSKQRKAVTTSTYQTKLHL